MTIILNILIATWVGGLHLTWKGRREDNGDL